MLKKILLLVCILITLTGIVWAEDDPGYKFLYRDSAGISEFETKTVQYIPTSSSPSDIIDVWIKTTYSPEGKKAVLQKIQDEGAPIDTYADLTYSLWHYQLRYSTRESKLLGVSNYSNTGQIDTYSFDNEEWEPILRQSPGEAWLECTRRYLNSQGR
jgi:hypothetical protein